MESTILSLLQQVKQAARLEEIVSEYVQLKQTGKQWRGLCPFHKETTPSFFVNFDKQLFRCYGCSASGDVLSFVEYALNYEFKDALQWLAQRYNLTTDATEHPFLEIYRAAQHTFETRIPAKVSTYLHEDRGLTDDIIKKFHIGYADSQGQWTSLLSRWSQSDLLKAGLLAKGKDGNPYPLFRGRVMFPITNRFGQTISFAGRTMTDAMPKFINIPETDLYKKREVLYGLSHAKGAIKSTRKVNIVEGYFDEVVLFQSWLQQTVASCGTALTETQLRTLTGLADSLHFILDGDHAGRQALLKFFPVGKPITEIGQLLLSLPVFVTLLPDGKDPDQIVIAGESKTLEQEQTLFSWVSGVLLQDANTTQGKVQRVLPLLSALPDVVKREETAKLADLLHLQDRVLIAQLTSPQQAKASSAQVSPGLTPFEQTLIHSLYLADPLIIQDTAKLLPIKSCQTAIGQRAVSLLYKYPETKPLFEMLPGDAKNVVSAVLLQDDVTVENCQDVLGDCVRSWQKKSIRKQLEELSRSGQDLVTVQAKKQALYQELKQLR